MAKPLSRTDRAAVAVLDGFFLLVILLLCSALLVFSRPRIPASLDSLTYTVRFPHLREEYVTEIHEGDAVLDAVGKRSIGRVVSYTVEPALGNSYDKRSGTLRRTPYPGYVTLTLLVRASGTLLPTGEASLSGLALMRGRQLSLRLPNFAGRGTVSEITLSNS